MNNKRRGISLIVLVITIIVIIILAAAIIITINKNNPISSAKKAVIASDIANIQDSYTSYISNKMVNFSTTVTGNGIIISSGALSSVAPNANYQEEHSGKSNVVNINLEQLGLDTSNILSVAISNNTVAAIEKIDSGKSRYYKKENQ